MQRVSRASVVVEGACVGEIERGFMILVGAMEGDDEQDAQLLARKISGLRLFPRGETPMDQSILDVGGGALIISQFTLAANTRKGRRPDFTKAEKPDKARALVDAFVAEMAAQGVPVQTGVFGAHMDVSLVNDGPVTIMLDSAELRGSRRS